MKIFVDADACPVKETIIHLAKQYGIQVVFVGLNGRLFRPWLACGKGACRFVPSGR